MKAREIFSGLTLVSACVFASVLAAEDISTLDGAVYRNVKLFDANPLGIHLLHSKGASFIPFKNLPEDVRKKYGYDPVKAEEYERQQADAQEALRQETEKKNIEKARQKEELAAAEIERARLWKENLKIIYERMKYDSVPYVTIKKMTCMRIVDGSFKIVGPYTFLHVLDDLYINAGGVLCKSPALNHSVCKASDFLDTLRKKLAEDGKELEEIPKKIADRERQLENILQYVVQIVSSDAYLDGSLYDRWGNFAGTFRNRKDLSVEALRTLADLELKGNALEKEIKELKTGQAALAESIEGNSATMAKLSEELEAFEKRRKDSLEKTGEELEKADGEKQPDDPSERLRLLRKLLDEGLITEEEYKAKRTEILSGI